MSYPIYKSGYDDSDRTYTIRTKHKIISLLKCYPCTDWNKAQFSYAEQVNVPLLNSLLPESFKG